MSTSRPCPESYAFSHNPKQIEAYLIANRGNAAAFRIKNNEGDPILHHAIKSYNVEALLALLAEQSLAWNLCDRDGNSPMHIAVKDLARVAVRLLLDNGRIDLEKRNNARITAAELAESLDRHDLAQEIRATSVPLGQPVSPDEFLRAFDFIGNIETAKRYIAQNVNNPAAFNIVNQDGVPAIHLAAGLTDITILNMLLAQPGVNVNVYNASGETTLQYAVKRENFNGVYRLLALPYLCVSRSRSGWTLGCGIDSGNILSLLREVIKTPSGAINPQKEISEEQYLIAAAGGDIEIVKAYIQKNGAYASALYVMNGVGNGALHLASGNHPEVLAMLLACMNPNVINRFSETPLHLAVEKNDKEKIKMLAEAPSINFGLEDMRGKVAWERAEKPEDAAEARIIARIAKPGVSLWKSIRTKLDLLYAIRKNNERVAQEYIVQNRGDAVCID